MRNVVNVVLTVLLSVGMISCVDARKAALTDEGHEARSIESPETITIVKDGAAETSIVIPDDASRIESFAAEELQYHIKKASGAELSIIHESDQPSDTGLIYIGKCKSANSAGLNKESLAINGYIIRLMNGNLYLYGNDTLLSGVEAPKDKDPLGKTTPVGTMSSVYRFLEDKMGVRWLWPGELGEYVPKMENISVKEWDKTYRQALTSKWLGPGPLDGGRNLWQSKKAEKDYADATILWVRRHRFNQVAPCGISHSFSGYWKRFGKTHPEYFAQLPNGKRQPLEGDTRGRQVCMCLTHGLVRQVVKDWIAKETPPWSWDARFGNEFIQCADNDSPAVCTCPQCRAWDAPDPGFKTHPYWTGKITPTYRTKGQLLASEISDANGSPSVSDRYAKFYLAVQKEAQKINPDVKVMGLAYVNYRMPPKETQLNDHIYISIVPTGGYPVTRKQGEDFRKQWDGWAKAGASMLFRPNMTHGGHNMPASYTETLYGWFTFAYKRHMKGTTYDSLCGEYGTQGPTLYLLARMQVRPDMPLSDILDEYYAAFGPAKTAVKKYFDYWEDVSNAIDEEAFKRYCREEKGGNFMNWLRVADRVFTADIMAKGRKLMEDIKKVEGLDETEKARVGFIDDGLTHSELTLTALRAYKKYIKSGKDTDKFMAGEAMKELFEFREAKEETGISNMGYLAFREVATWDAGLSEINRDTVKLSDTWKFKFDPDKQGVNKGWYKPECDDARWADIRVDACWEKQAPGKEWKKEHGKDYDGIAWYRTAFTLNPEDSQKRIELLFNAVDESCVIYLNGTQVHKRVYDKVNNPGGWNQAFTVDISDAVHRKGKNVLAVAVEDQVGAGGIWKPVYLNAKGLSKAVTSALKAVKEQGVENMVARPSFEGISEVKETTFGVWPPKLKDHVKLDSALAASGNQSIKISGFREKGGSFNGKFQVKPGEEYLVGLDGLCRGKGVCKLVIGWRNKKTFLERSTYRTFFFPGEAGRWSPVAGIVTVPTNAHELIFAISVANQDADSACYVDNLFLYKLTGQV